ncbi:nitrile hydratase accessory protein [Streptomyces sp. AK02-04a]|uniref:nitrile hydratase accessory protein n=1 Tax=Streptomyces sp. AK02-04a TaxID=3028649 RepID=UPI0029ADD72C|nr:nitrile hydratase accessory protein [Streptomyces sp. AK02-04a]MDX3763662.1 nitrile hydratase accessory protein [Streptomyces sp. AK02-04a]
MTQKSVVGPVGAQGTMVDRSVSGCLDGPLALPRSNGELVFEAPWQGRAFGMAVSLSRAGFFTWETFRSHLAQAIAEKGQDGVEEYYQRWLDALEMSLARTDVLDCQLLHDRQDQFRARTRDEIF